MLFMTVDHVTILSLRDIQRIFIDTERQNAFLVFITNKILTYLELRTDENKKFLEDDEWVYEISSDVWDDIGYNGFNPTELLEERIDEEHDEFDIIMENVSSTVYEEIDSIIYHMSHEIILEQIPFSARAVLYRNRCLFLKEDR